MRPTLDELHQSDRYRLLESFPIDEMMAFVQRELNIKPKQPEKPISRSTRFLRLGTMMLLSGLFGYVLAYSLLSGVDKQTIASGFWQLGAGFMAFFLILPIHEFIHGLAFKRLGAPRVGYGWAPKSLMVYAYSQNFPATMREVAFVAIMPFLVITTALLVGWVVWPSYSVFWITLLLVHTGGCLGDFALINYWYKNRHRVIYTYDDVEGEKRSYFFEQI
jgi:cellulose synthase/poly-beta-1,6-N-acetylglucosamine synthase-like glycosyltransferase